MKFRKKPVVITAEQWFENGDHPEDGKEVFKEGEFKGKLLEGKIVRYFRHPKVEEDSNCLKCNKIMHIHGRIDTLEGGHTVCPGDWIIKGIEGEFYPCKPNIFEQTYEEVK